MDLLQHAVIQAEQQMGIALPTQHVALLFAEASKPGYAGTNYESHIVIANTGYDVDDGSHDWQTTCRRRSHTKLPTTTGAATQTGSTKEWPTFSKRRQNTPGRESK